MSLWLEPPDSLVNIPQYPGSMQMGEPMRHGIVVEDGYSPSPRVRRQKFYSFAAIERNNFLFKVIEMGL